MREALDLAKEYVSIPEDKIKIIMHCCKSLLYDNETLWIKKGASCNFDNLMGAYYVVELCELVGCLLLNKLNKFIDRCKHGLYQYDGLIIVDNCTSRKEDVIWKKLHWLFNKFAFNLDIQTNLKITYYLDVMLDLCNGTIGKVINSPSILT